MPPTAANRIEPIERESDAGELRRSLEVIAELVRELAAAVERANGHRVAPMPAAERTLSKLTLRERLEAVERNALLDALTITRGNRAKAARLLGTTERVFNYGVRKYGIDWRRFKS